MRAYRAARKVLLGFLVLFLLLLPGRSPGADLEAHQHRFQLGLRLGYGWHAGSPPVRLCSLLPRWGMVLFPASASPLPGRPALSLEVEGIVSLAEADNSGGEIGLTPLLKLAWPLAPGLQLFLEGGAGIIGELFDSPAVPHAFNFTPQIGAGLEVALTPRLGVTGAYRFRHSSNAGIYRENPAFNVHMLQIGLVYYY